MPELNLEQKNSDSIEATTLNNGDQLDFINQYASEDRADVDTVRNDTLQNLSRLANETARTQLDQMQQTPEKPAVTSRVSRMTANLIWMRDDYDISHISLN